MPSSLEYPQLSSFSLRFCPAAPAPGYTKRSGPRLSTFPLPRSPLREERDLTSAIPSSLEYPQLSSFSLRFCPAAPAPGYTKRSGPRLSTFPLPRSPLREERDLTFAMPSSLEYPQLHSFSLRFCPAAPAPGYTKRSGPRLSTFPLPRSPLREERDLTFATPL